MSALQLRFVVVLCIPAMALIFAGCQKRPVPVLVDEQIPDVKPADDEPKPFPLLLEPKFNAKVLEPIDRPLAMQPIAEQYWNFETYRRTDDKPAVATRRLEIAGRVLTEEDEPAEGTQVLLIAYDEKVAVTRTSKDGRFSFGARDLRLASEEIDIRGPIVAFHLVAFAENRSIIVDELQIYIDAARPSFPSRAIYRGEKIDIELKHGKTRSIRGRIVDEKGIPLGGAQVRLISTTTRVGDRPRPFRNDGWSHADLEPTTGNDGSFQFSMLPAQCKVTVEVRAAGFACTRFMALSTPPLGTLKKEDAGLWHHNLGDEWIIRLVRPVPQRVQVVDKKTGLPLSGFVVSGFPIAEMRSANVPIAGALTDANGYAILWLPPGRYHFHARQEKDPQYHPAGTTGQVSPATADEPYQVAANPYIVTIEVFDADTGVPIKNATVQLLLTYKNPQQSLASGMPRTYYWGETKSNGKAQGLNPFEGYTARFLQNEIQISTFKVVAPQGFEAVEVPEASFDQLVSTKPVFRFTIRKKK